MKGKLWAVAFAVAAVYWLAQIAFIVGPGVSEIKQIAMALAAAGGAFGFAIGALDD